MFQKHGYCQLPRVGNLFLHLTRCEMQRMQLIARYHR